VTIFTKYRKNSNLNKAKEKQEQYLTSEEIYYEIIAGPRVGSPHQDNQEHNTYIWSSDATQHTYKVTHVHNGDHLPEKEGHKHHPAHLDIKTGDKL